MSRPSASGDPAAIAAAAPAARIRWTLRQVTLAGFGLYREPTQFAFPPGAAVSVGPNESGKSTLLSGIAAVLFGLPAATDPSKFGAARFRSFSAPKEFWGEVVWEEGDGRRFRLHRRFDTHQVLLEEQTSRGPERLFTGEHNPAARSSSESAFAGFLREHLGLGNRELFLETLCVEQPLAGEDALSADLQHLLSGSRSGRVDDVLVRLFEEVKRLTRGTGDLGLLRPGNVRAVNQKDAGRIEGAEAELEEARTEFEEGERLLAELNRQNDILEQAQERARALKASAEGRQARVDQLRRWLALNDDRRRRLEAVRGAEGSLRQLDDLEARRKEMAERLEGPFAPFRRCPDDLPARIESALGRARSLESARAGAEAQRASRRDLEERRARTHSRLAGELRDVRGRGDLLARREQLLQAIERGGRRASAIAEIVAELERPEERPASSAGGTGTDPAALRARVESLLEDVRRLDGLRARIEETERELAGQRFLAEAGRLDALREKVRREERLRKIRPRLRELELLLATARQAEETRRARAEAEAISSRVAKPGPLPLWLRLLLGAGAGLLARYAFSAGWTPAAIAMVLVFAVAWVIDAALARRRRAKPVSGEAGAAGASSATREPPAEAAVDTEVELASVRSEVEALESGLQSLGEDLGPYAQTTAGELARMEEGWRLRAEEQERCRAEADALARRHFSAGPDDWRAQPVAALPADLRPAAALCPPPPPETCGALTDALGELTETIWRDAMNEARAARDEAERRRRLQSDLERLRAEQAEDVEEEKLRSLLEPFTAETPEEELRRLLVACAEEERNAAAAEEQLALIPAEEEISSGVETAESELRAALAAMRGGWDEAPAVPGEGPLLPWLEALRELEREARQAWIEDGVRREAAQGVLQSAGVAGREALADRETTAKAMLAACERDLETLERTDPFFASTREIVDPLERGRRLAEEFDEESRRLDEERVEIRRQEEAERGLLRELAGLEGRPAPNVARLEVRIRALEAQLVRLKMERDALALAFRWVREAADRYQEGYREELEQRVSTCFERLTGRPGRRLRLDEKFRIHPLDPDGQELAPAQLSQGARDQLLLSIRLAVADLLAGAVELPLFFDDPFLHFDEERLGHLRAALERLAETRQWVLWTHREEFSGWGGAVVRTPRGAFGRTAGGPA